MPAMSAIPDASSSPTLAERWIKANIVAAIISGVASFAVYGVKHAVGAAEPQAEFGALQHQAWETSQRAHAMRSRR